MEPGPGDQTYDDIKQVYDDMVLMFVRGLYQWLRTLDATFSFSPDDFITLFLRYYRVITRLRPIYYCLIIAFLLFRRP